jgi:hypothetical protein
MKPHEEIVFNNKIYRLIESFNNRDEAHKLFTLYKVNWYVRLVTFPNAHGCYMYIRSKQHVSENEQIRLFKLAWHDD